jgi:gas vesicle protein
MDNQSELQTNDTHNVWGFLGGLLVGSLAGAIAMLLFVPQSGKKTRTQIQEKSIELRDQTVKTVEDTVEQVRSKANQITASINKQAEELQQRGQDVLDEQKDRWTPVLKAGKTAVQDALS